MLIQLLRNTMADALVKVTALSTDTKEAYVKATAVNHNLQVLEKKFKQKPSNDNFIDGSEETDKNTNGG